MWPFSVADLAVFFWPSKTGASLALAGGKTDHTQAIRFTKKKHTHTPTSVHRFFVFAAAKNSALLAKIQKDTTLLTVSVHPFAGTSLSVCRWAGKRCYVIRIVVVAYGYLSFCDGADVSGCIRCWWLTVGRNRWGIRIWCCTTPEIDVNNLLFVYNENHTCVVPGWFRRDNVNTGKKSVFLERV